jgi:hypothetical protein
LAFGVEYARWLEEHSKQVDELRTAVSAHAGDSELQAIIDAIVARSDEIFRLKGAAAKTDAYQVLSGTWTTPVERCFLWLGGIRPSELLKVTPSSDQQSSKLVNKLYSVSSLPCVWLALSEVDASATVTCEPARTPDGEPARQYLCPATFLPASRRRSFSRDGSAATVDRRNRRRLRIVVLAPPCRLLRRFHGPDGGGGGKAWRSGNPPAAGELIMQAMAVL